MKSSLRRRDKKLSKKMQRSLDPAMLLARGLSARHVGANVMQHLAPLTKDEMEKDLRHMTAFYHANIAYAQQHYLYVNRDELGAQPHGGPGGGHFGSPNGAGAPGRSDAMFVPPVAMPVRIDPEEEKRLQNLRKKIALCETQREFLEGQYVSLRAHYVALSKQLTAATKHNQGQTAFLQTVSKRRAKVLALRRARLQMTRDVLACLQTRMEALQAATQEGSAAATSGTLDAAKPKYDGTNNKVEGTNGGAEPMDTTATTHATATTTSGIVKQPPAEDDGDDDITQAWNEVEEMLKQAELACRDVSSTITLNEKRPKKRSKKAAAAAAEADEENNVAVLPWEALKMPQTPPGIPLLISQLALVPDKGAAFTTNGTLGCRATSMCWLESNLPSNYIADDEEENLTKLREEVQFLENELTKERTANKEIQIGIIARRKRSDELVAMMTLLRSETEAVLQRHNILLDSPEAKEAATSLHERTTRERAETSELAASKEGEKMIVNGTNAEPKPPTEDGTANNTKKDSPTATGKLRRTKDDDENDGDDEGGVDEDEDEEGEIRPDAGGTDQWETSNNKRVISNEAADESLSQGRKRRKL